MFQVERNSRSSLSAYGVFSFSVFCGWRTCNVQIIFDVVYVPTRMGHGDGRKTLGHRRVLHDRELQERAFCNFFFRSLCKNVDDRTWVIYTPDCCLFFEFRSSSLLAPHSIIHILLGLALQRKLLNALVQPTLFPFYLITGFHRNARLAKLGKTKLARWISLL